MATIVKARTAAHDLPGLSPEFWSVFTSRLVDTGNGVRLHAISGGRGAPVLIVNGWPLTWYTSRRLMPMLANDFHVVVLEQRGVGLSDKPTDGYDTATLARDAVGAMAALGHDRFHVVGEDIGAWTGYALAADFPEKVERYVHAETITPGITTDFSLIPADRRFADLIWHLPFNRASSDINERMVRGREDIYIGHQFATKAKSPTSISQDAVKVYVDALRDPVALRSSFEFYRSITVNIEQNTERLKRLLTMPVLALGGEKVAGPLTVREMEIAAGKPQVALLPDAGHYIIEEDAEPVAAALRSFLS